MQVTVIHTKDTHNNTAILLRYYQHMPPYTAIAEQIHAIIWQIAYFESTGKRESCQGHSGQILDSQ
jgi:hypothetical protein